MTISLPCVKGTSEKLQRILRTHKIRATSCIENIFQKLLCKPKDRVATDDKNNKIDCKNCKAIYFGVKVKLFPWGPHWGVPT